MTDGFDQRVPSPNVHGLSGSRSPSPSPRPTGSEILGSNYDGDHTRFSHQQLSQAHDRLTNDGYSFVGFKGTTRPGAQHIVNNGLSANRTDKWSGIYVSDHPEVAAGYTADDMGNSRGGQLLRIYVPNRDAERLQNLATPLDNPKAEDEFRRAFSFPLGDDRSYIIRGAENSEDPHRTETILSAKVADRAVGIPSTVRVDQKYGSGAIDAYPDAEKLLSTPPPGRQPPSL
ncbi:hypothetical protein JQX13_24065 [Archangium violaceum]|uniref:hypothetical protein n=1 Tax=Archangium violaceum TaxID=83451 RepID=UPI00193BC458|nr:hypothetical protein [Archangium violaceum]QRK12836.1 hypothetical protein JQX13_24065 [Archangium violaceum]